MKIELWLCIGYIHLANGNKGVEFVSLNEKGERQTQSLIYGMKVGSCYAGMTYDLTFTDDLLLYGKPKLRDPWHNKEELAAMQIASRAVDTEFTVARRNKKASESKENILECLKPLREAYNSTNAAGRTALIAQVITFMQRR